MIRGIVTHTKDKRINTHISHVFFFSFFLSLSLSLFQVASFIGNPLITSSNPCKRGVSIKGDTVIMNNRRKKLLFLFLNCRSTHPYGVCTTCCLCTTRQPDGRLIDFSSPCSELVNPEQNILCLANIRAYGQPSSLTV